MTAKSKAPIGTKNNITPIHATNLETGEVMELGIPSRQSKAVSITGYYSWAPGAWLRLRVSPLEANLIHLLLEHQDSRTTGVTHLTQREMAEMLHSSESYIQRRLAGLQRRSIIVRTGQGRYRVNSHIGFQGSRASWQHQWVVDRDPDWTGTKPKLTAL